MCFFGLLGAANKRHIPTFDDLASNILFINLGCWSFVQFSFVFGKLMMAVVSLQLHCTPVYYYYYYCTVISRLLCIRCIAGGVVVCWSGRGGLDGTMGEWMVDGMEKG